jgi:calcium/calmodulin-dependent serine protein kinase
MLIVDQNDRPTVQDVLNHPWIKEREKYAPKKHLQDTVDELRRFNIKRKIKGIILAALSSIKWNNEMNNEETEDNFETTTIIDLNMLDNVTSNGIDYPIIYYKKLLSNICCIILAIATIIDSLEEMQYLIDNNNDFVEKAFEDKQLNSLLQVYDACVYLLN